MGDRQMHSDRPAACPRCGYDQRGEMAKWMQSCPLVSTCTECGLLIDWRELFNPDFSMPSWCVESAEKWRQIPWRSVKTLWMMLRPWRFWRDLRMSHEIRWSRIVGMWTMLLIVIYFTMGATQALQYARLVRWGLSSGFITIGDTVRDCAVNFLAPFSPIGTVWTGTCMRYAADLWGHGLKPAIYFLLANVVMAAGFMLLPISRRRAKVRYRHVLRILAYGLAFAMPPLLVLSLGVIQARRQYGPFDWAEEWRLPSLLLALAAFVVWWSLATSRYLRMPHSWGIGAVLTAIAALVVVLLMALTGDRSFLHLLIALP